MIFVICDTKMKGLLNGKTEISTYLNLILSSIMKNRLHSSIALNNALNGFRRERGMGTSTLENNMDNQPAGIFHESLFQVYCMCVNTTTICTRGGACIY